MRHGREGGWLMCLAMASFGIVEYFYLVVGPGHLGFVPVEIGAMARLAVRWIALCNGRNKSQYKNHGTRVVGDSFLRESIRGVMRKTALVLLTS